MTLLKHLCYKLVFLFRVAIYSSPTFLFHFVKLQWVAILTGSNHKIKVVSLIAMTSSGPSNFIYVITYKSYKLSQKRELQTIVIFSVQELLLFK